LAFLFAFMIAYRREKIWLFKLIWWRFEI
jgi:hypothetical protein